MSWQEEDLEPGAIIRFEGRPNDPTAPNESTRLKAFKLLLTRWFWRGAMEGGVFAAAGTDLAEQYVRAKIATQKNQAARLAADAAIRAAVADQKRQANVKTVN